METLEPLSACKATHNYKAINIVHVCVCVGVGVCVCVCVWVCVCVCVCIVSLETLTRVEDDGCGIIR